MGCENVSWRHPHWFPPLLKGYFLDGQVANAVPSSSFSWKRGRLSLFSVRHAKRLSPSLSFAIGEMNYTLRGITAADSLDDLPLRSPECIK